MNTAPELSVVVPSHNRAAALAELMDAIERQTLAPHRYELIVVLDGCTDDSAARLGAWAEDHPGFALRVVEQHNQGQAAARTLGARRAAAPLLLFLDDDIVPGPGCLAAHLGRHAGLGADAPLVVLGDARVPTRADESYYDLLTRMWWDQMHDERTQRFPRVSFRDFCSHHVSLPRWLFERVGGFDPAFVGYGGEDYELGHRLLRRGAAFVLEPEARAAHHHRGHPRRVLRNLLSEGRNDVRLGTRHPELRRRLRCASPGPGVRVLFATPVLFAPLLWVGPLVLRVCEGLGLWMAWRRLLGKLRYVAYWTGVRRGFAGWAEYRDFLDAAPPPRTLDVDATRGLPTGFFDTPLPMVDAVRFIVDGCARATVAIDDLPHRGAGARAWPAALTAPDGARWRPRSQHRRVTARRTRRNAAAARSYTSPMPRDLRDRVIVITGASSGIGAATALRCAAAGMRVVLAARRADKLATVAQQIDALSPPLSPAARVARSSGPGEGAPPHPRTPSPPAPLPGGVGSQMRVPATLPSSATLTPTTTCSGWSTRPAPRSGGSTPASPTRATGWSRRCSTPPTRRSVPCSRPTSTARCACSARPCP